MFLIFLYIIISTIIFYLSNNRRNISSPWLMGILLLLALVVGLGDMLGGYDRYIYCDLFDSNADRIRAGGPFLNSNSPLMGYRKEMSYVIWNCLIAYITPNRYIYILITTLFVYTLLFYSLRDIFKRYPISVLIFMGLWFFFTFTYLRQVMATSCAWLSYRYVVKKKFVPFLILWFVAYEFHNSAIIFFIFYFIPKKKWSKKTIIIVLILFFIVGVSGLPMSVYHLYDDALDAQRASSYAVDYPGIRFDYVLEVIVMVYLILSRYREIPEDREELVYLNAALMFCIILLTFLHSSNAGRQSWYYMLGIIYILSFLSSRRKSIDSYIKIVYILISVLYFRIVFGWGILLSPYKSFLTNGHRADDPIYLKFEYDDRYDSDKFYRPAFDIYVPK